MPKVMSNALFTAEEMEHARRIRDEGYNGLMLHRRLVADVIEPARPRIDALTGQENNSQYLGYLLIHLMGSPLN